MARQEASLIPCFKTCLHGSAVMWNGGVTLYLGKPGSGKTRAVIEAMRNGGRLVADDYVCIEKIQDEAIAYAPENGRGMIEARHCGIARVPYARKGALAEIVFLDEESAGFLPAWLKDCAISYSCPTLAA